MGPAHQEVVAFTFSEVVRIPREVLGSMLEEHSNIELMYFEWCAQKMDEELDCITVI